MTGATAYPHTTPIDLTIKPEATPVFDEVVKDLGFNPFDEDDKSNDDVRVAHLIFEDHLIALKDTVRKAYLAV